MKNLVDHDKFTSKFTELTENIDKQLLEMVSLSYMKKVIKTQEIKFDNHIEMSSKEM